MITAMRSAVADLLHQQAPLDVWEYVPPDVAAYPCVVVGRVTGVESDQARVVFDLTLDVYVCGRSQSDDAQDELDKHADQIWSIFGGTRSRSHDGLALACTAIAPTVIALAGNQTIPAYVLTVESALTTC